MDYLIASTAVVDQIFYKDIVDSVLAIGGAGFYAYCGARIFSDSVRLTCGKGSDFDQTIKPDFVKDQINDENMFALDLPTPRTIVKYKDDGERVETPVYGVEHYQKFVSSVSEIEKHCKNIKGLYIFKEAENIAFWSSLIELKKKYNFKILWEVSSDTTIPKNLDLIKSIAANIDIFSINKTETMSLFDCSEIECEDKLQNLDFDTVFYRKGASGASMINKERVVFTPSIDSFKPVDPTGAGNSSSAAVLVGYCENKSLFEIGTMGSISAGFIISQNGAPLTSSPEIREQANEYLVQQTKGFSDVR